MENELTEQEEWEYKYLRALQANRNRWFSGDEFNRLKILSEKKYKLNKEENE